MFLDKKTRLKIWLNPGLNLTISDETGPEYLFPSQWVPGLSPTYSLPLQPSNSFTVHQSVTQNQSNM